jgi:hypothetical protein
MSAVPQPSVQECSQKILLDLSWFCRRRRRAPPATVAQASEVFGKIFKADDFDKSGGLAKQEFQTALLFHKEARQLLALSDKASADELNGLFASCNVDGGECITKREVMKHYKQIWEVPEIMVDVTQLAEAVRDNRYVLLALCILVDVIGFASYLLLVLGEFTDLWWAPMFGFFLQYMFGSAMVTSLGAIEEFLPFTDILPTATIAWCITYLERLEFLRQMLGMRQPAVPGCLTKED